MMALGVRAETIAATEASRTTRTASPQAATAVPDNVFPASFLSIAQPAPGSGQGKPPLAAAPQGAPMPPGRPLPNEPPSPKEVAMPKEVALPKNLPSTKEFPTAAGPGQRYSLSSKPAPSPVLGTATPSLGPQPAVVSASAQQLRPETAIPPNA